MPVQFPGMSIISCPRPCRGAPGGNARRRLPGANDREASRRGSSDARVTRRRRDRRRAQAPGLEAPDDPGRQAAIQRAGRIGEVRVDG